MSDNLEPIELKFVLNSPEVMAEFQKMMGAVKNYDASIDASKKGFSQFVSEQLKAINVLDQSAQLTEKQAQAIKRHGETLDWLQQKQKETNDPTQLALYTQQLHQVELAIQKIAEAANKNVQLMNPEEIQLANQKLEEAIVLMDKISDTHISTSFASPEELEVLSNEINKTEDGFQQLATVIDFVQAKMAGMDSSTTEFKQLQADVKAANDLLGRTPQLYDATGNSINQMNDALKVFQTQLADETDPESIKILNQNIETLEQGIQQIKNVGKSGFDEFGKKIEEQKEKSIQLQTELEGLVNKMAKLRLANQEGSIQYEELKNKAVETRTAILETNKEINAEVSPTTSFDKLIQITSGITAGFTLAQGATALFGAEQEEAEKVIQKVTGAMAVLQSLQEIQIQLKTADTTATGKQTAAQALYTAVVGTSSGALKIFRIALATTGIGLVIILLAALIANWDKVTATIKRSFPALEGFGDKMDTVKAYVMGFLKAYLSLFETVWKTLQKLKDFKFKEALDEVKNVGANAINRFNEGKQKSLNDTAQDKRNSDLKKAIEQDQRNIEVIEARTGQKQYDRREKNIKAQLSLVKKGSDDEIKLKQDLNILLAEKEKQHNDAAKKALDKSLRDQESAAKKAQQLAEKAAEARRSLEEKVQAEINKLNNKELEGNEISQIKTKWQKLRDEANKVGAGNSVKMSIDINEKKEVDIKNYELETKEKLKHLNQQKELYAAYETFKTSIAQTEFAKRNNLNLEEFGTFSQIIDAEIKKLTEKANLTAQEAERLKAFQNIKVETDTNASKDEIQKLEKAAQDTITYRETIDRINKEYDAKALLLQRENNVALRNEKLAENERQKQEAIDAANGEAYVKTHIFRQLSDNLVGITKQELAQKIEALQIFLANAKGLTPAQRQEIEVNLGRLKGLQAESNITLYINTLLERKKKLEDSLNGANPKSAAQAAEEAEELAKVNAELKKTVALKAQTFAAGASELAGGFHDMASAIGESNEGLADTLSTIGDILNVASSAASAFASFASGDIIGGITGVMKTIAGIFSIGAKARESERKAQEEMKKYQDSIFQSQLDYNAELRKRIADEVKLNDLYKSRVDNIKEEIEANKKNAAQIIKDQQDVFNRLLKAQTVVGMHTEKYGGFLGIGKKTRTVEDTKSIAELLGVGKWVEKTMTAFGNIKFKIKVFEPGQVELTDDIFDKLEKLNAEKPLTGDAKLAYDQLKKLRDEYGSIAEANRQLEIQLKNAITGTTAQTLADSIREGLKSGKKTFADFANDIEGFLREAILAGISAKMIEPKIQELQDALAEMMGDGILSADERAQFQAMYMAIVSQSQEYMDIINQAGVNIGTGSSNANSLQGALKGASQESIDILSGHTAAMKLTQFETNTILKSGFAQQLEKTSQIIELQIDIEKNTRRTADNTEKIHDVNDNVIRVAEGQEKNYKALQSAGIIK